MSGAEASIMNSPSLKIVCSVPFRLSPASRDGELHFNQTNQSHIRNEKAIVVLFAFFLAFGVFVVFANAAYSRPSIAMVGVHVAVAIGMLGMVVNGVVKIIRMYPCEEVLIIRKSRVCDKSVQIASQHIVEGMVLSQAKVERESVPVVVRRLWAMAGVVPMPMYVAYVQVKDNNYAIACVWSRDQAVRYVQNLAAASTTKWSVALERGAVFKQVSIGRN